MTEAISTKTYFPSLNGVRFIAAFSVLIHHTEQIKELLHENHLYDHHLIKNMGKLGVGLFFVLSGFLITYLLLQEKGQHQRINTRDFYIRRVLRIWPLYFLIVLGSFFVFQYLPFFETPTNAYVHTDENFWRRLSLFLLVLPNIAFILYESPYLCAQTWSIGVEELFYYIWPWIIQKTTWRRVLIVGLVFSVSLLLVFTFYIYVIGHTETSLLTIVSHFFSQFRILTLMIGGMFAALLYFKQAKILAMLFRREVQLVVYGLFFGLLLNNFHIKGFHLEFYGLFFGYFILNVSSNPRSIIHLEYGWVSYLGKISYGLYIYHPVMIVVCLRGLRAYFGTNIDDTLFNTLLYGFTIAATIVVAGLSYRFFEKPFLTYKERFNQPSPTPTL
jgi:peptidoglycan/LPS O-acetylase OafA/YrhL